MFSLLEKSSAKIKGVYGSRGIGKTTLLMQLLDSSEISMDKKLYISCDHSLFFGVSLFDFVDEFCKKCYYISKRGSYK